LKLWNSIMSGLLLVPLAVAGCPSDDTGEEGAGTTEADDTTSSSSSSSSSTAAVDSSSGESSTTSEVIPNCQIERPLPDPPAVDCSGATMTYEGSVILEEGGQDDISLLEGVSTVTGAIRVNRMPFTDLDFMACVTTVGRDVTIFGNEELTNIDGLYNLTSVEDIVFSQNNAIEDFNGLPLLEQIDGSVVIRENAALRTITGFHSFVGLNGMGIDPDTMEVAGGNLTIQENPLLEDMDGFGQIRVVNGRVQVTNNPELCISSVMCVVEGIVQPAVPPDNWSTSGNKGSC